jgi:hypothetical protein
MVQCIVIVGVVALGLMGAFKTFGASIFGASRAQGETVTCLASNDPNCGYGAGAGAIPPPPPPSVGSNDVVCSGGICTVPGNCFVAGTPVATPDGDRAIEELRVGDLVLARDEQSGEVRPSPVTRTFITPERPVVDVRVRETPDAEIRATPGHPFWTTDRGWIAAAELGIGEELLDASGRAVHVDGLAAEAAAETVFNLEIADLHTYFVGAARVWVHNACTQTSNNGGSTGNGSSTANGETIDNVRARLSAPEPHSGPRVTFAGMNEGEAQAHGARLTSPTASPEPSPAESSLGSNSVSVYNTSFADAKQHLLGIKTPAGPTNGSTTTTVTDDGVPHGHSTATGAPGGPPNGSTTTTATVDGVPDGHIGSVPAVGGPTVLNTGAGSGITQSTTNDGRPSFHFPPGTILNDINGDQHNWYSVPGGSSTNVTNGENGHHWQAGGGVYHIHHWPDGSVTNGGSVPGDTSGLVNYLNGHSGADWHFNSASFNNVQGNQNNYHHGVPGPLPAPQFSDVNGAIYHHYVHPVMPDPNH